jgi:uncharacterized YccA/Bax inhibitor family protein
MLHISIPVARSGAARVGVCSAVAGLGGGMAMAVVAALIAISRHGDIWLEAKQIAAIVYGQAAIARPELAVSAVVVGTLIHLVVAGLLGLLFGFLSHSVLRLTSDFGVPVLTGMTYGLLIWLFAYFILLPRLDPVLRETYLPAYIVQHIVYGMVTGLLYSWLCPHSYI